MIKAILLTVCVTFLISDYDKTLITDCVIFHIGDYDKAQITAAFKDWQQYTCLKFVPATSSNKNRIVLQNGEGCSSYVGMSRGSQVVTLAPGCRKVRHF